MSQQTERLKIYDHIKSFTFCDKDSEDSRVCPLSLVLILTRFCSSRSLKEGVMVSVGDSEASGYDIQVSARILSDGSNIHIGVPKCLRVL